MPTIEDFAEFQKRFEDYGYTAHIQYSEGGGDRLQLHYRERDRDRSIAAGGVYSLEGIWKYLGDQEATKTFLDRVWLELDLTKQTPTRWIDQSSDEKAFGMGRSSAAADTF